MVHIGTHYDILF